MTRGQVIRALKLKKHS